MATERSPEIEPGPARADLGGLPTRLSRWIIACTGAGAITAKRLPGGNRRQAWAISAQVDGGVEELFLRLDPAGHRPGGADPYTLAREALICRGLAAQGIPVPEVLAVDVEMDAVLMRRLQGDADYYRIPDVATKQQVARELITTLARMHQVDATRLDTGVLPAVAAVATHVRQELDTWAAMYRETGRLDPMVELGLRWLDANVPEVTGNPALVQGDTGPGNFIFDAGHFVSLIDLEFAHLGDPLEDLAWLSLRSAQEPVPDFAELVQIYQREVGTPLDLVRLRYHRVFAELRVVIIRHRAAEDTAPAGDVGNGLLSRALHRRLFVEALAAAAGIVLEPPGDLQAQASPADWLYESVLRQLREEIVPLAAHPLAVTRGKGVARIVKYLRSERRYGAALEAAERTSAEHLLEARLESAAEGRELVAEAISAGRLELEPALRHLARVVAWETAIMRPAMGALADRKHAEPNR